MIPIQSQDRVVTQNINVGRSMNYRLDARNLRHIVTMLRDSVYSNKLLAVIREYATNALDAHVAAEESGRKGTGSTPIEVNLPTKFSPELRIRDFGPGLSTKEIEEIYISLGESTKRTSNKYVGSLGFGCKSAFAYGDRFIVTSWNGGTKTIYNNVLDDNVPEGARCDIMASAHCPVDETGIEICIPIRQNEIEECKQVALNFFKYWRIFPSMTGATEQEIADSLSYKKNDSIFNGNNWVIYPRGYSYGSSSKGIALMGDVPYSLDWDLVKRKLSGANLLNNNESVLFDFIQANNTILTFDIGELEFSVSRETLQYTDYTCKTILDRILVMFTNIQEIIQKAIENAPNLWEAKRLYGVIFGGAYNTEYSEDEKKQFGGELHRLEPFFKDRLLWNGVKVEGSSFTGLNMWEVGKGKNLESKSHYNNDDEFQSILTAYRSDKDKIRKGTTRRRRRYNYGNENGNIIPNKSSVVIINNLSKPHGFLTIIRYLLQSDPKTSIRRVYALKFGAESVRKEFYKEYNFETVPVQYASELLNKAKAWYSTVKPSRGYNSGPTGPLQVRTFRKDPANGFGGQHTWRKEDVKLRDLDKISYFVPIEKEYVIANNNIKSIETYHFMDYVACLNRETDWLKSIPVIYGILPGTRKTKWFNAALKNGLFVNLFDYINSKSKEIDLNQVAEARHYNNYISTSHSFSYENYVVNQAFANVLKKHLKFDGKMSKLCKSLTKNYSDIIRFDGTLQSFGIKLNTDNIKIPVDYKGLLKDANNQYPLVDYIGKHTLRHSEKFSDNLIIELARYINMIDAEAGCDPII